MKERVLIIKAGYTEFLEEEKDSRQVSFGDILRVTPLLHLYKDDDVTWMTDEQAFPLLEGNKYISRLMRFDWISAGQLKKERFDTLINLEKVPGVCAIADDIYSVRRYGFRFDPEARKAKAYDNALDVLTVSSDPKIKKQNTKTAQELLFGMVGKKWRGEEYILSYQPKTNEIYDIGFNTIVGKKWPIKSWPVENWNKLENMLSEKNLKISRQEKQSKEILTNLDSYMDWLNSCNQIVTIDSLGLHLALALKKKVIGLFGPTPFKEVYFYNRGEAIFPENFPCKDLPCFQRTCSHEVTCMGAITPEKVYEKIIKQ